MMKLLLLNIARKLLQSSSIDLIKKSRGNKSKHKVGLDREILVTSDKYNLIGSIHHHGNTITSGHYTSNIFYAECAYICNDIHTACPVPWEFSPIL